MTIVASNSLTVSNVNDGTITHTAYANSADGMDGFTTDYKSAVGLDILNIISWAKNTSMSNSTYNFVGNSDSSFKVTGKGTGGYEVLSKSFPAKVGDKLRFTVRYTNRLAFGLFNNYGLQFVTSEAYTESVTSTSKIVLPNAITGSTEYQLEYTATTSNVWMQLNFGGVSDGAQVDFDVKIEVENLTNPVKYAYMGTYTDYAATDSTNPSDYTWSRILGERGKQIFKSSYESVPHNDTHYWSDLSPAPSIDNPPKIGDTVITPSGNILQIDTVTVGGGGGGGTFGVGDVLGNIKGPSGSDGTSGIIVSSVVPDSPQTGQLWQDTSTTPQLVKKWTGTSWVIWELYAQNLKADKLETLSAKIGKIYNEFDNSSGGIDNKGTITIEDSVKVVYYLGNSSTTIDLVTSSSGQGLFTQYLPNKTDTSKFKQSWYMPTGLYFTDSINNWNGQITAENVTLVPWKNLTYLPGFTTAENNPCQYRKFKNLDGSYTVQLKGQVKPVSGRFNATGEYLPLQVPAVIKPSINAFGIGLPDFTNIQSARLVVLASDGRVQLMVRGNATDYVSLDMMSYTL